MEIWLLGHGEFIKEVLPAAQRTFDLGFLVEALMLRGVDLDTGLPEKQRVGPWWSSLGEIKDHASGRTFTAADRQVSDFQREVSFAGYKGHIDCLLSLATGRYVMDVKTTQGFGFDRHREGNLLADPFAREYVYQLHFYIAGLKAEGLEIEGGVLLFFNKEQSQVQARFVDYDQKIVAEIEERLAWATNDAEPEPDWGWVKGSAVPLRCGYCPVLESCARTRNLGLNLEFTKKGRPQWVVQAA